MEDVFETVEMAIAQKGQLFALKQSKWRIYPVNRVVTLT